tara:strand:+ start:9383 stop:10489 length:1107 start_codon:yes stop_codon:yes gene_type:complete
MTKTKTQTKTRKGAAKAGTKTKSKKPKYNKRERRAQIKEQVANALIEQMKKGVRPWEKPWEGGVGGLPMRVAAKKPYRGINVWWLMTEAMNNGYKSNEWGTFNQWKKIATSHALKNGDWEWAETKDGKRYKKTTKWYGIKKAQQSTVVIYWNMLVFPDKDDPDSFKKIPMMDWFNVFNRDQTGLPPLPKPKATKTLKGKRRIKAENEVDEIIKLNGVDFREKGSKAFYTVGQDFVQVPVRDDFKSIEGRLSTILHELTHWTGNPGRLNRDMSGMFGSEDYAHEELVAEMGAALLCAAISIPNKMAEEGLENHAAYLANWMKKIRDAKDGGVDFIFKAAAKSQKAAELLMPDFFGVEDKKVEDKKAGDE